MCVYPGQLRWVIARGSVTACPTASCQAKRGCFEIRLGSRTGWGSYPISDDEPTGVLNRQMTAKNTGQTGSSTDRASAEQAKIYETAADNASPKKSPCGSTRPASLTDTVIAVCLPSGCAVLGESGEANKASAATEVNTSTAAQRTATL